MALTTASAPARSPAPPLGAPRWYAHGWNRPGLYRLAAVLAAGLPRRARHAVAAAVGGVAWRRLDAERTAVAANLARVRPDASGAERAALVRALFRRFAVCFADLVAANRSPRVDRLLAAVHGEAFLAGAVAGGRGAVVITAHLGNWELGGRLLAGRVTRPTHVVVAAEPDPRVERFLRGRPAPVRFVPRTRPTIGLTLYGALRRGDIVAVQGDRALGDRTDVDVPFFGARAAFPIGPFALARAAGVPVVPAFCTLDRDRRYTVVVGAPIGVPADGETVALGRWVGRLEDAIRQHPDQWFNFFDVWGPTPAP